MDINSPVAHPHRPTLLARVDEVALRALHAAYWARADFREARPLDELFTEDAVLTLGNVTLSGRSAIADFFRNRQADMEASRRTTRHVPAELHIRVVHDGEVVTTSMALAFAGHGPLPIQTALPSLADFTDSCTRQADGRWLFAARTAAPVFAGPEAPRFAQGAGPETQAIQRNDDA